jgi:hypothetical protein
LAYPSTAIFQSNHLSLEKDSISPLLKEAIDTKQTFSALLTFFPILPPELQLLLWQHTFNPVPTTYPTTLSTITGSYPTMVFHCSSWDDL